MCRGDNDNVERPSDPWFGGLVTLHGHVLGHSRTKSEKNVLELERISKGIARYEKKKLHRKRSARVVVVF